MNTKTNTFIPSGNYTTSRLEKKLLEFFRKERLNVTLGIYSVNQRFQIDGVRY